jgi:methylenetetrahydrofolate--tRNA-(uracil-5-)-methyltransferase
MKPVGLTDPKTGRRPYACVQLRRENAAGSLYNLVGFQTQLKWGEQEKLLRLIPALAKAEFARFGSIHRNTYVNAPAHLNGGVQLKNDPRVFLAGQLTGVEGYTESAGSGLLAGLNAVRFLEGKPLAIPPRNTMLGSLANYLTESDPAHFQPINAMWGLVEPVGLPGSKKKAPKHERFLAYRARALDEFEGWLKGLGIPAGDASKLDEQAKKAAEEAALQKT